MLANVITVLFILHVFFFCFFFQMYSRFQTHYCEISERARTLRYIQKEVHCR